MTTDIKTTDKNKEKKGMSAAQCLERAVSWKVRHTYVYIYIYYVFCLCVSSKILVSIYIYIYIYIIYVFIDYYSTPQCPKVCRTMMRSFQYYTNTILCYTVI